MQRNSLINSIYRKIINEESDVIKKSKFEEHRPECYSEFEVQKLCMIGNELLSVVHDVQKKFVNNTLRLPKNKLEDLCVVIIEFAEDLLNDIGIWNSLESYNQNYFDTSLPFCLLKNQRMPNERINIYRLQYLLWNKYQKFFDGLLVSPNHQDLLLFVEEIFRFFNDRIIAELPDSSSLAHLFDQPNQYGWDVKKKLLWLGRHSYLFRHSFEKHMRESTSQHEIQVVDDFVCQHATEWSGLGVVDILVSILAISEDQKNDLRNWYQRHFAYFEIESIDGPVVIAKNIISNKPYLIRVGQESGLFKVGEIYTGSLVPWNGEWYWSGQQFGWGGLRQEKLNKIRKEFLIKSPQIAYRYCDDLLKKAQKSLQKQFREFVNFHGEDLVVFPDGYSMAAAIQKEHRLQYEAQPKEAVEKIKKKYNLKKSCPSYSYPRKILESENGIGLFFNQIQGQEIMLEFNSVLSGIKKNGIKLTDEEKECIRDFVQSQSISHQFVEKLTKEYGAKSIAVSYFLGDFDDIDYIQFILRKYKGHGFRTIYPNISFN